MVSSELLQLTTSRFANKYKFAKPNDRRALDVMNAAAKAVVTELPDITIAYGISDEYRLVWPSKMPIVSGAHVYLQLRLS